MAFLKDDVPKDGPVEFAEEHWRLVAWMKEHGIGVIEYLNRRMVDRDARAALYYIQGQGMGVGQDFAMVRGHDIYLVSVYLPEEKSALGAPSMRVSEVSLPEFAALDRDAVQRLLASALHDYYESHCYMWPLSFLPVAESRSFDWTDARWVVRPEKHSLLYWRTQVAGRWSKFQILWWPQIRGTTCSPLVAALALAGLAWNGGGWPMILAGVWLIARLLKYDSDWRLGPWMLGRVKFIHPFAHLWALDPLMNPRPLATLKVRIECVESEPMVRVVRVVNQSFLPVRFVSISHHSLAGLLAPGLIESLRRKRPDGGIDSKDSKELERKFPSMTKKWLWPKQSFARRHRLFEEFPLTTQTREVRAVVSISRFVSGERRSGTGSFMLEVDGAPN